MTAFIDTNVLIRHLTGDPPDLAERATAFLGGAEDLLLADNIVAESGTFQDLVLGLQHPVFTTQPHQLLFLRRAQSFPSPLVDIGL